MLARIVAAARGFARANNHSAAGCSITLFIYFLVFNVLEANIEKLIWGNPFTHALDPVFVSLFLAFGACSIWFCVTDKG